MPELREGSLGAHKEKAGNHQPLQMVDRHAIQTCRKTEGPDTTKGWHPVHGESAYSEMRVELCIRMNIYIYIYIYIYTAIILHSIHGTPNAPQTLPKDGVFEHQT